MPTPWPAALEGAACRLHEPIDGRLVVAEGIATALAAAELFKLPAWAAMTAWGLERFEPPPGLTELFIAGDNDSQLHRPGRRLCPGQRLRRDRPETRGQGRDPSGARHRLGRRAARGAVMRGNGSGNGKIGVKIGEQFVPLTRSALDRLRALSVRARRFVLFLMSEHLSHGGRENGYLKAPHRQLAACGIGRAQRAARHRRSRGGRARRVLSRRHARRHAVQADMAAGADATKHPCGQARSI